MISVSVLASCKEVDSSRLPGPEHGLHFDGIPSCWEEAIPLGNGLTGALIWQKDGKLRISIDRADLWDLRDVEQFDGPDYSYDFVCRQVMEKKDISPVQAMIDRRTAEDSAPTKIPAGALEFDISGLGAVSSVDLDLATAVCDIVWENGASATFFVPADGDGGFFRFRNLTGELTPELKAPAYQGEPCLPEKRVGGRGKKLANLGYAPGEMETPEPGRMVYTQKGWGDFSYRIDVRWKKGKVFEGRYRVTSEGTWYSYMREDDCQDNFEKALCRHKAWWREYWNKSAISIPDTLLERQWYLEMYKFGASSRPNCPPISLQAVWTADNGETPPWRGDYHNDLNTQLSYWPGYSANHLDETAVFTDWLWKIRDNAESFTKKFFRVDGLNVPGIATLTGKPLGGWSPYSHSPAAAGWLAFHFWQQWKFSMDNDFLRTRAYPWVREVARYFENVSVLDEKGVRSLPLSSSPEINDNRIDAWFPRTTNYDLACIRVTYLIAGEMARTLGLHCEADYYEEQLEQWPDFATGESGLLIAPGVPMAESHRHFSHLLAFHPFGILDPDHGEEEKDLILRSVRNVEELGPDWWAGYSYAWLANMKARLGDGDGASRNLHIFSEAFCSPNSFHLNGDQSGRGYSKFDYKPFTLEGNFACAAAIQEMLLQSHTGVIKIFPAVPSDWKDASFSDLRAMGAFLVSAQLRDGKTVKLTVVSEKGGLLRLENPFTGEILERNMMPGEVYTEIYEQLKHI